MSGCLLRQMQQRMEMQQMHHMQQIIYQQQHQLQQQQRQLHQQGGSSSPAQAPGADDVGRRLGRFTTDGRIRTTDDSDFDSGDDSGEGAHTTFAVRVPYKL